MVDENGVVRIVGTVTFTDPNNQPAFNGGTITGGPLNVHITSATTALDVQNDGAGPLLDVRNSALAEAQIANDGHVLFVGGTNGLGYNRTDNSAQAYLVSGTDLLYLQDSTGAPVVDQQNTGGMILYRGVHTQAITSGALPTVSPSTGTAFQCATTRDVHLVVPFTLTTAAGTCKVELSPDDMTFSTLVTLTPAVNASVSAASLHVPAAWWVKLTVTNAALGTGTYY